MSLIFLLNVTLYVKKTCLDRSENVFYLCRCKAPFINGITAASCGVGGNSTDRDPQLLDDLTIINWVGAVLYKSTNNSVVLES